MTELNVIAAAVIGGTSLAGGIGTIYGGILGALFMQSLENGMILIGVPTPLQKMVLAARAVLAVWIDIAYRQREPAMSAPLVELRGDHRRPSAACTRVENVERRSGRRRGARAARPQRRRQVDADQDALRRLSRRTQGEIRVAGAAGADPIDARRQGARHRDDLSEPRACRRTSTPSPISSSAARSLHPLRLPDEEAMEQETRADARPHEAPPAVAAERGEPASPAASARRSRSPARSISMPTS